MNLDPTFAERARADDRARELTHDPEHPRERHEHEDYLQRHFDFARDPSSVGANGTAAAMTPGGRPDTLNWELHAWTS
jgi:hypothetical protein